MSKVTVMDHPLIRHKLTLVRDRNTEFFLYKSLVREITYLMLYEATRELRTRTVRIDTPLAPCDSDILDEDVVIIPIMRAGLGMLEGCLSLMPMAKVGFAGMYRDEETLEPIEYYYKIPDMERAKVLILDPMLATGGSVSAAVAKLKAMGARELMVLCILAAPEGVERVQRDRPDVDIICAAVDDGLDEHGYVIPGLGDCGDRLYGTGQGE